MKHLSIQSPLLPVEKKFWEIYAEAVETSGPSHRAKFNERVQDLGIDQIIKDPNTPLDLACLATIISERAKIMIENIAPTSQYQDALRLLNTLHTMADKKTKSAEEHVFNNIRTRYLATMAQEKDLLELERDSERMFGDGRRVA